jgi:hypothetical protein
VRFPQPGQEGQIHTTGVASDETLTLALVRALTTVTGRSHEDLKPLQSVIDMDALESLRHSARQDPVTQFRITFTYGNYEISLNRSEIQLKELPDRRNP